MLISSYFRTRLAIAIVLALLAPLPWVFIAKGKLSDDAVLSHKVHLTLHILSYTFVNTVLHILFAQLRLPSYTYFFAEDRSRWNGVWRGLQINYFLRSTGDTESTLIILCWERFV